MNIVGLASQGPWGSRQQLRIQSYIRHKRLYDGFVIRADDNGVQQYKPLRYNLARPIIHAAASFLAGKEITFIVQDDEEATKRADQIWTESGGSATFMQNALLGLILGDACIMPSKPKDEETALFRWLDPSICYPMFDAYDIDKLISLVIAYEVVAPDGKTQRYREEWNKGKITYYLDDTITDTDVYDEELYEGVPAVWIRNYQLKSDIFGRSDLQPIAELVEQYDHMCEKQSRIIDYYASPNIFIKGVSKKNVEVAKGERTMYFLPADGDIGFVEWQGTPPAVEEHLNRVRETISEVSEVPQIAFSKMEGVPTNISGVALKLLYGPLMSKTERKRQTWGPALERAMQMALLAEGFSETKLDSISIEWQNPLPSSEVEAWQIAAEKEAMGVSKRQILREQGYTEQEVDQFEKEKQEEQDGMDKAMMKQYAAGQVPGSPYPGQKGPAKPTK